MHTLGKLVVCLAAIGGSVATTGHGSPLDRGVAAPTAARATSPVTTSATLNVAGAITALRLDLCNARCVSCGGIYEYDDGYPRNAAGGPDQDCIYDSCADRCSPSFTDENGREDAIDIVRRASILDDAGPLVALIQGTEKVRYNVNRHAVQVFSCDLKSVVASFPVGPSIEAAAEVAAYNSSGLSRAR